MTGYDDDGERKSRNRAKASWVQQGGSSAAFEERTEFNRALSLDASDEPELRLAAVFSRFFRGSTTLFECSSEFGVSDRDLGSNSPSLSSPSNIALEKRTATVFTRHKSLQ